MLFWLIAGTLSLLAVAFLALAALRRANDTEHPAEFDLRVYRDQLKDVDKDVARGVIDAADAGRIRVEISRRILAADAVLKATKNDADTEARGTAALVAILAVVMIGMSVTVYSQLGAPGFGDMPLSIRIERSQERLANRMSQIEAEAEFPPQPLAAPEPELAELILKLRETVKEQPNDLQGQELLARTESSLGNMRAAYTAQGHVIRLKGDDTTSGDYSIYANMMIGASDGYVSPEAQAALRLSLELDPQNNLSRYYWGLMLLQNERPDLTFQLWDQVLRQSPPNAPWVDSIRSRMADLAWFAGVDYQMPAPPHSNGLAGPSADDVETAKEMSSEDRQEMIQSMVANLAERLATEGGSPEEWARLLTAYGVLGQTDRAAAIWEEAKQVFAEVPNALETVRAGARNAGVAQ
ncbi:c-type cytochrome biogenesis protein CcmI [Pseudopelagicola sp. nBUS_20]|uniref:c-type cytochrome biogenesis protein CcmI n=1 Tax=Pseudopelagicola sp. nBUS_20 TaxID=3395317 RepID=UPI003EB93A9D